jgi:glycosyltransferase involved in cell wall biosynthesis
MAAKSPKLVLMTADTVGGVWHYAIELAAALGAHDVRVVLATMGAALTPAQHAQAAAVSTLEVVESEYKLEWMVDPWDDVARAGEWLLELERALAPDYVHLNQFAFGALPFRAPALVVAHSCVLSWWRSVHGRSAPAEWDRYREVVRRGLEGARLVVAPTRAMLSSLEMEHSYCGPGLVIANGRSAQRYLPRAKEQIVLSAGRLWDAAKNVSALEAVAPQLAWPVLVAGARAEPGGAERPIGAVQYLGELASNELLETLSKAPIYALPARYEPFGLSILEAALAGCALVVGDLPSLREVWGSAALYVHPDDHRSLCECLSSFIEDSQLRALYAREARRRALTYSPQRMASDYLSAYTRMTWRTAVRREDAALAGGARACVS